MNTDHESVTHVTSTVIMRFRRVSGIRRTRAYE